MIIRDHSCLVVPFLAFWGDLVRVTGSKTQRKFPGPRNEATYSLGNLSIFFPSKHTLWPLYPGRPQVGTISDVYTFLSRNAMLPRRVCCSWPGAVPVQHVKVSEQAQESTSPRKMNGSSKSPVGDISVVTLIRTDTTLDRGQKAERV